MNGLDLVRAVVPRWLRNALRRPGRTLSWVGAEWAYRLGRVSTCELREGFVVRCHPASWHVFASHREDRAQAFELDGFVRHARPGMVLLDVGAHYGLFTLAALHFGGETARAIAVEPSPEALRVLRANVALAHPDRARVFGCAAGERDGVVSMLTTGANAEHYLVGLDDERSDSLQIECLTLGSIVARVGWAPTHVKIDVEGFEDEVLRGSDAWIAANQPVVFLELHSDMLRRRGIEPRSVLERLLARGYRLERDARPADPDEIAAEPLARVVALPPVRDPRG